MNDTPPGANRATGTSAANGFLGANGSDGADGAHGAHGAHGAGGAAGARAAGGGGPASIGSLTSEAGMLLDALALRLAAAQAARPAAPDLSAMVPAEPLPTACPECGRVAGDDSASCAGCPLCRLLSVLRGERPEVTATLVDAAALFVSALRAVLPNPAAGRSTAPVPAGPPATRATPGGDGGVQRIRIE